MSPLPNRVGSEQPERTSSPRMLKVKPPVSDPITRLIASLPRRVALVGVAKNCGKTTTLNALLERLTRRPVGLVSVGIDGEREDLLLGTEKPSIVAHPGQWVVSSEQGFALSTAHLEYVEPLGFTTPMGEVHVARVLQGGEVMLSGMRHGGDLHRALEVLTRLGAEPCLIDGAYGRTIGARASLVEGVILSTGAILSPSIEEIVEATCSLVARLSCPAPPHAWQRALLHRAVTEGRALLGGPDVEPQPLKADSALLGVPRSGALWREELLAIAAPGLVSDRVLEALLNVPPCGSRRALILEDGTRMQASGALLKRFERRWDLFATERVELLAVSFNPTRLDGSSLPAEALSEALQARLGQDMLVFDPLRA